MRTHTAAAAAAADAARTRREESHGTAPWGVVGIKAQAVRHEIPMQPITALRNALGRAEGGSGTPIDAAAYGESVAFWSEHAVIK
jgi:Protein of unknown function (DUF3228)